MFSSISLLTSGLLSISVHSAIAQTTPAASPSTTTTGSSNSTSSTGSISSLAAGLSPGCQSAAGALITSDFGQCANIMGLATVIGGTGSIVPPMNNWITSICAADPCSNSTLTSAQQTISSGCGSDAQKGSPIAESLNSVIVNFSAVRSMLCSQYTSNSTFCVTSILENVQTVTGTNLTVSTLLSLISGGLSSSAFAQVPQSAYCNDCGHAIITLAAPLSSSSNMSSASHANMTSTMPTNSSSTSGDASSHSTGGVCGASFHDGKVPSSVRIAAKNSTAAGANAKNSGAAPQRASVISAVILTFVSMGFMLIC